MKNALKPISSENQTVWMTQPKEIEAIMQRQETAFATAQGKYEESGNIEMAMQTAEAFGRGLFADMIKEKPKDWTMKEWINIIAREVLNPLGTGATVTKLAEDVVETHLFKSSLHEAEEDQHLASVFTYGFLRGILLSAFPKGELLMNTSIAFGAPTTSLVFKAHASIGDSGERERVKTLMTTMKTES